MNCRYAIFLLLLIPAGDSIADAVIFETDFQSPPQEDWFIVGEWTFGNCGAVAYNHDDPSWEDLLFTQRNGDWVECIYFIPDGTDSLLIEIPYYIHVNNGHISGSVYFDINALVDTEAFHLFDLSVWQEGDYEYEGTIEYVINRTGSGWLGLSFNSAGGCEMGGITSLWQIHGVTVTAFGDDLDLAPLTWASVKSFF